MRNFKGLRINHSLSILLVCLTSRSVAQGDAVGSTRNQLLGATQTKETFSTSPVALQLTSNITRRSGRWDGTITNVVTNLDEVDDEEYPTATRTHTPNWLLYAMEPPLQLTRTYHGRQQHLTRAFFSNDSHVAIYFNFDPAVSGSNYNENLKTNLTWLYDYTSRIWPYMIDTYGLIGPDPYLTLIIRTAREARAELTFSCENSKKKDRRNMLDIATGRMDGWLRSESRYRDEELDRIVNQLANFVERSSKDRFGSPSHSIWKGSSYDSTAWEDIFTYDVYKNLNMTEHSQRYKQHSEDTAENQPKEMTFWFRDWFLPIYENHGENKALNEYFELLYQYLPFQGITYNYNLTLGDFVHFWSGAAGTDLQAVARDAFGWNDTYREQFIMARTRFPGVARLYKYIPLPLLHQEATTTTTTTTANLENLKSDPAPMAIGLTAAVPLILIAAVLLAASVIFYKRKIRNLNTEIRTLTSEEVNTFFEGGQNFSNEAETQAAILAMPFIKEFEISRDRLIPCPNKVIGSGQFGLVMHGFIQNPDNTGRMPVAVKTVKGDVEVLYFNAMLAEAKILAYLGRHDNIVRLLGTCTANIKNREIYMALELCPFGDLHKFLQKNRNNYKNMLSPAEHAQKESSIGVKVADQYSALNQISTLDLLKWAQEISNAMVYLTHKKVIHGDLAARNVLLTRNRIAQISDFGLSRQLLNYANYKKTSEGPLPWRWMAIEALNDMKFSVASDVWAFGITLWEMFSLAQVPYPGWIYNLSFVNRLMNGERLESPQFANEEIFELMKTCWNMEPIDRPKFYEIHYILGEMITQLQISKENVENKKGDYCM